jgi:DNA modification methylase
MRCDCGCEFEARVEYDHLLACGDCAQPAVVAKLMQGQVAALAPVDPPYNVGVSYDGETVDDEKAADQYERFCREWFGLCQTVSERQIVTPGCANLADWLRWFDAQHWAPWTKTNSMTNGRVSRFWCWEPVLFFGDKWPRRRANDVFDYPIGQQKDVADHPCPKPLAMWEDLIANYSEPGDLVFDAFSGSGTTLIACEKLGRRCRATEISPAYVAVALERFLVMTGETARLVEAAA